MAWRHDQKGRLGWYIYTRIRYETHMIVCFVIMLLDDGMCESVTGPLLSLTTQPFINSRAVAIQSYILGKCWREVKLDECCLAKNPKSFERRDVMEFLLKKPIFLRILLVDGHHFEIMLFMGFHAKRDPTIRVKMFITLEMFSDIGKVKGSMFITLQWPSEDGEEMQS